MKSYLKIFFSLLILFFFSFYIEQINFIRAMSWPESYNIVSTDDQTDGINNPNIVSDQLDLTNLWAVNNNGTNGYPASFYVRIQVDNIHHVNKGNCYEFHWNPDYDANLFYKVTLLAVSSSAPGQPGSYTIAFWKSVDQEANWTKLVEYAEITNEDWNLSGNNLGYRIKSINNGYVEMRVSESLFNATTTQWNVYAKTTFGSAHIYADMNPNSGNLLYNFEYNGFTTEWPEQSDYKDVSGASPDPIKDYYEIPKEQQEIFEGYLTDSFHNIFVKVKLHTVATNPAVGMSTKAFLNASGTKYANIWYAFEAEYTGSNKWDLSLRRSTNSGNTWSTLESHKKVSLINGEYNSGTLGLKITTGSPGYIEWYTKKQYIEEPASSLNLYYKTVYGSEGETVDRSPDSGSTSNNLDEWIDQVTIDPPNLAPETVKQGEINVPMTMFTASTSAGTVEWTALRIDKSSSSTMEDIDVERIKIWKDDGDQTFETDEDMMVADKQNPFSNGTANITLSPVQIFTTSTSYYFITYDINWFSGVDRTVGMYIKDKTYFTVSSPDNVNFENFPFIAGDSKITPEAYLSFYISGVDSNTNMEGATSTVSTGSFGWINFGNLIPNSTEVAMQNLNVINNTETGYRITIKENNDLTNVQTQDTIPDIPGTNASPCPWPSGSGFGYHTSDDSLGSGVVDRFSDDDTYAAITSTEEEVAYHGSSATSTQITTIVYKLEADSLQPVGNYNNIITYICTAKY
ncbi:MAG: hypothetical protein QME57_01460 [Patescibacteria group bacterium]|nr:hypothetical protein [Patescibacteria group bacterium]